MRTSTRQVSRRRTAAIVAVAALAVLATAGCATTRPVGEQLDDAAITAKVKAKLAGDPELNPFEFDVDTEDGVVRLSGHVETESDRAEAERLARNTEGVRRVVNDVQIGDPTTGEVISDNWIGTKIKAKLTADPQINPFNIDVDVIDGVVTLSGTVKDAEHREHAEEIARNTDGVKQVNNLLRTRE